MLAVYKQLCQGRGVAASHVHGVFFLLQVLIELLPTFSMLLVPAGYNTTERHVHVQSSVGACPYTHVLHIRMFAWTHALALFESAFYSRSAAEVCLLEAGPVANQGMA